MTESAVRAADRESPEVDRQRTGAERPEEGDGRDEGMSQELWFRLYVFCVISNPQMLTNPCPVIVSFPAQRSADKVHSDTEQTMMELQRSVERLQELMEEVLDQAHLEKMSQAQEVADSLEAEIKVLKKRDTEMRDLAQCEDHIHYLQVRSAQVRDVLQVIS